jgi:lipase ATG15
LPDFSYEQADSIRYPSCRLSNELKESPITSMADFTYLAGLAYRGVNVTQRELDGWFGINVTTAQNEAVEEYRQTHEVSSQVSFKLVTHPKQFGNKTGDFAYILIRGTTNNWDMLTDAQLWSPAALMQVLRMILPFGTIWTPIMPYLINAITTVESASIAEVSFYQDTTAYANYIKQGVADGQYLGVSVTGHSLGKND